ncbi:phosphoribosylformylglycinamidine synthase [Microplitis demolitor]|uniref:phosphoribosylformylglycinamidine synthase n=1 Tax=Microplitis demolitor TaxID=69319 RepID=UPI00235B5DA1|nr:phosphoribosylformylglycinamidine synthase [Microplitis demolitor]
MVIAKLYKSSGLLSGQLSSKLTTLQQICPSITSLQTETCYYIESDRALTSSDLKIINFALTSPFDPELYDESMISSPMIIEIGPRLNFSTAFSSNAVSILKSAGLSCITRVEKSTRYCINSSVPIDSNLEDRLVNSLHDRMTECRYNRPIESFDHGFRPEPWFEVEILQKGRQALVDVNARLGLAFDDWDLDFYTDLFKSKLKRNPTSVECFDLAQSNSEHSRHWFFRGKLVVDGLEESQTLFDMITATQRTSNPNNVIKFADNSSAIKGYRVPMAIPRETWQPSAFQVMDVDKHLIFTAETHNFPTGVAPFSGATTGTGGRIRDIQGCGRGGYYIAGTAGYSVGNLFIPGYQLPWEVPAAYPSNLATPLEIIIEASNGASDYGNKFGEPVISGFARTFGMMLDPRVEWIKPIMFSGGCGTVDANMIDKVAPEPGMQVAKIGGPVYRIGVGGGAASSVAVQGTQAAELDFGAVQRGDAEMEQKLNRVVRGCMELGDRNPILSIHDQGAGGNGNVLKELVEPAGAVIFKRKFELGDPSISTLELWGAEYQENDAILCHQDDVGLIEKIAKREKCPVNFVGTVTGSGKIILSEEEECDATKYMTSDGDPGVKHPVDLDLEFVLGKMPQKTFAMTREPAKLKALALRPDLSVSEALDRVLRLPSVGSKRYLTNKVDRCVTGLVAQQQCVGPLHTPLADVAVTAISHFSTAGLATSIGEQPIKGLVNVGAGARMTVIEAVANLVFAKISNLRDVKCSGNWMWAAKLEGEGAKLYDACRAMCQLMSDLGIAIDGGKDSLSMAARIGSEVVKAPGTLVVSCYAPCPDITKVVTPDIKGPSRGHESSLIFVDLSRGKSRLGGTALAQVFNQLGDEVPDVENAADFVKAFEIIQQLITEGRILSGHDVSDGGLITCFLEMAFAGLAGLEVKILHKEGSALEILFAEEVGWVLEVASVQDVLGIFQKAKVPAFFIGKATKLGMDSQITVDVNDERVLDSTVFQLMKIWEETSAWLEKRQTNVSCAEEEFASLRKRRIPYSHLSFDPDMKPVVEKPLKVVKVAVVREEGINGDREMAAACMQAGFEAWDVTVQDLLEGHVTLDQFRGVIFPGGFSYADVLGSAKGWAASLLFHPVLRSQLDAFKNRSDTFSLGVCNGCQLMSLLGWVGSENSSEPTVILDHNKSERFECRWSSVRIEKSKAIMLKGMDQTVMGVWVAHGEGKFTFRTAHVLETLIREGCVAIRYADDAGQATESYPMNPNGSIGGVAGVCSTDGRHLAMMPHPERCTQMWQWPYVPAGWTNKTSPWLRIFQNAFDWCSDN